MSVHYKFKSALDYDTVTFDGLHISVGDLKAAISQQKRIGKTSDFDLQITNAQTKEVYVDDNTLIPKNTSLLVARVPLSQQPKKQWEGSNSNTSLQHKDAVLNKGLADLSRMEGSEQDKINAMITQSTFDYDPSNYQKIRGQNQRGVVPSNYVCFKCQKRGHWIKDCPVANSTEPVEIRRSTGIPRSFMVPVEGPKAPGAMMTPSGTFAVPAVDHEAYLASENAGGADTPTNAPAAPEPNIPDDLICSLCRDLLTDAVMIPCCGNSFCDECIRGALLESEDHECPDCREKEIAPTTLIPNRFLRNSVSSFRNQTGYSRKMPHRPAVPQLQVPPPMLVPAQPPPNVAGLVGIPSDSGVGAASGTCAIGAGGALGAGSDSDGSADDNITVTVPPAHTHKPPSRAGPRHSHLAYSAHPAHSGHPAHLAHSAHSAHVRHSNMHRPPRYGPPPSLKPPGLDPPVIMPQMPRVDEQRASTPTIDERRDPMSTSQIVYNRGPPLSYAGGSAPPSSRRYNPSYGRHGPSGPNGPPFNNRYPPPEPYQPPPPGIKDSPTNGHGEDPLEAFNRMIREKEMRAKRREEERRRVQSGSHSRSRSPRSVRSPRSLRSPRSPRALRSPRSPRTQRSPRSPRSQRSQRSQRSPRSPAARSPRARPRSRGSSRIRYSRSRSMSRGRLRRSPWSPRRRRTRERTLSLTRSPSPRRRHRSLLRYRSPLRSPVRSPLRSPARSPLRSPARSPRRSALRSPPRALSPHRYTGLYDEMLSPPPRPLEPPYGPRYGSRGNMPLPIFPLGIKPLLPIDIAIQPDPPGYRGRYDAPPFEDVPPGVEPPVPGFEPSPFEKPSFGPPGLMDRERLPPPGYRESYRAPYVDGPTGFRDVPLNNAPNEIPVHVGDPPRFRENYRPFRDQGSMPFRDGQPFREPPYRDNNYRGGPQFREGSFRNINYREGAFRDNPPHNFREGGGPPFRPPSADPREQPPNFHDSNFRDNYRDDSNVGRDSGRPGFRSNARSRGGSRRNQNVEHDRHRETKEREGRERERYNENRDPERVREVEKRAGHDKTRESRDDRPREHERNRDYDKERDREHERSTPDKKSRRSPKPSREAREKIDQKRESKGRSRDRDINKREKKEEKPQDKISVDKSKDHKEKEKKIKERKRKKREKEKEKDTEKKKKREKKDKKDKDILKKEEGLELSEESKDTKEIEESVTEKQNVPVKYENKEVKEIDEKLPSPKAESEQIPRNELYGEEAPEAVDKEIIENYVKIDETICLADSKNIETTNKDEPFDGIELQANTDEFDMKADIEIGSQNKEMLAPLPELSKWEVDEESTEKAKEPGEITSPEEDETDKVTSDVLKRAENAIFAKAISSLRPIEIKKISGDRVKLYGGDDSTKSPMNNIQITVPVTNSEHKSIEINEKKKRSSKTPPPRLSVKERLGGKVEDIRRPREARVVQSTVELVKSRSKTPKHDQPYRRVTVDKDKNRKNESYSRSDMTKHEKRTSENAKSGDKYRRKSPFNVNKKKDHDKNIRDDKKTSNESSRSRNQDKETETSKNHNLDPERKKSTLDEAHFEPDYDENLESDNEIKEEIGKKRERTGSPSGVTEAKKAKLDSDASKSMLINIKKRAESESESSSDSDDSSSSSSSDARKRKKKKKRAKKKKKRAASDSESESDSSSDDHKKKKKKRKHKKKSSKKKKKSKHK